MRLFRNFFLAFGITLFISKLIGFRSVFRFVINVFIFIAALFICRIIAQVAYIIIFQ
jgi:hypothetical protein